ncbi:MAG TPA: hypothetical protein VKV17_05715 [Bryobacteraceae bacterium]|nr:hypothetical protein [Bryobacteraceae bacterium]
MLALWAEMELAVSDQFRDGNVPAHSELLGVRQRAAGPAGKITFAMSVRMTRPLKDPIERIAEPL